MMLRPWNILVLAIAILCLSSPFPVFSEENDYTSFMNAGTEAFEAGNYAEAEKSFKAALALAQHPAGDAESMAITLFSLGETYRKQQNYAGAASAFLQALALDEQRLGASSEEVGVDLVTLAGLYGQQGRYKEAVPLFLRALPIAEKTLGSDHPGTVSILSGLAEAYAKQGLYSDAIPLSKRVLAIREKVLGPEHPSVAESLRSLAELYKSNGDYSQIEPLYRRALAIDEKAGSPESWDNVSTDLVNLAGLYAVQGRYKESIPLLNRALAIAEKELSSDDPVTASILIMLASSYAKQELYSEAIPLYERALAINEKVLGTESREVARDLNNLATFYWHQGRYGVAEAMQERALGINEKLFGPESREVATGLNNLALVYRSQGRYGEAEPLYQRALAIDEKVGGAEAPALATDLNNLAELYMQQGRYAAADSLFKRSLAIYEKAFGPEHPKVALALSNLAITYVSQGRYAEAAPLLKRALTINADDPEHRLEVAVDLHNLAQIISDAPDHYAVAEELQKKALGIHEKALGPDHPMVARDLSTLAKLYAKQGRYTDAEPLYRRVLAIDENALGPESREVALDLNNLAHLYNIQERYSDAVSLYQRSLAIEEKVLGHNHPEVATILNNLADLYHAQGHYTEALSYSRRAVTILRQRFAVEADSRSQERRLVRNYFVAHVNNISHTLGEGSAQAASVNESFETAQLASEQSAAQALAQMAARFAAGNDALAQRVRERQDLLDQWRALDKHLVEAASAPPAQRHAEVEQRLREELATVDGKLKALDATLAKEFPDYAALANPQPISIAQVQAQLHPDEAMVMYLVGEKVSYLWVVNKREARLVRLEIGQEALAKQIQRLRTGLDQKAIHSIDELRAFDVKRAHRLYEQLLAPIAAQLQGVKTLLLVLDGPLQSLPFAVLVTEAPTAQPHQLQDYRSIPWLINRYSLATLPSAGSLKALRRFAKRSEAPQPFVGFGDPSLGAGSGSSRGLDAQALFSRGGLADLKALQQLPSLPDTAQELHTLAKTLKASNDSVYLQGRATETQVEHTPLSRYRVVAFATHGLMAGEFKGQAEPALVLTPPKQASAADDGLLTASEVAQLKLNADWVVLSACNTAAADGTPGAEGLSGLAKAFFYAGGRALLVSNWSVSSQAAQELTTTLFKRQAADPHLGQAQALREAMLAVRDDPQHPYFAHPFFWAPFIVVGAGE